MNNEVVGSCRPHKVDATHANAVKARNPLRASQALRAAIRKRGGQVGSITYFYSAKNNRDLVFSTEVAFACGVLLEADERVKGYELDDDQIKKQLAEQGFVGQIPSAIVTRWAERPLLLEVMADGRAISPSSRETRQSHAALIEAEWGLFDKQSAEAKSRLLHDWIQISPILSQHITQVSAQWDFLSKQVCTACFKPKTLGELRAFCLAPWELVFTTIFRLSQLSILTTDLDALPLSASTVVKNK